MFGKRRESGLALAFCAVFRAALRKHDAANDSSAARAIFTAMTVNFWGISSAFPHAVS